MGIEASILAFVATGKNLNLEAQENVNRYMKEKNKARYRLPQTRVGGQGPYLRSLQHFSRSSEAKDRKNLKKVNYDGWTDGWTD